MPSSSFAPAEVQVVLKGAQGMTQQLSLFLPVSAYWLPAFEWTVNSITTCACKGLQLPATLQISSDPAAS